MCALKHEGKKLSFLAIKNVFVPGCAGTNLISSFFVFWSCLSFHYGEEDKMRDCRHSIQNHLHSEKVMN